MRVLLDTTFASRAPLSGTGVYLERLAGELSRLDGVDLVAVANERRRAPAGGGIGSARNLATDVWWLTVELPRLARRRSADLIHHPLPARAAARVAQVVTVHDLAFERLPGHFDPRYRTYAHITHSLAARSANAVICVSETTAGDAKGLWEIPGERIVVAPHGPGQITEPEPPGHEPDHFLYVGDDEPRKDLPTLLDAYQLYRAAAESPIDLVLAGSAKGPAGMPGVRLERRPSKDRLAELYVSATALVHTSLYEGFGLTALEAMSIGTPVIATDAPGVRETCGEAALYARPGDAGAVAKAMGRITETPALRADLAERGRRRAEEFSWAASARAHLAAYSLALEKS